MNGFMRTLVIGLAALGVILLTAIISVMVSARGMGWSPTAIRSKVLTADEQQWLARMNDPPATQPRFQGPALKVEEALEKLAEMANSQHANELVKDLRARTQSLTDRDSDVGRREAELQLARADLARLQRTLDEQIGGLAEREQALATAKAAWAQRQLAEVDKLNVLHASERGRYQEQARLFEQMKDNAWTSLRQFPPNEIARYLAFMEPKKAARMLVLAQQDERGPSFVTQVHRAQLGLDLSGASETQIERMAGLYLLMAPAQVLPYFRDAPDAEVADLMFAMAKGGNLKQRAALMEALQRADPKRQQTIQRLIEAKASAASPAAAGG